ncbi:hypothetical protein BCR33DRAFT_850308 [Rhizoclosmatium globosum]|uniref:Uncharacterized protein n=1 Tax=Rhizoclosmatium globosum TaxID=329046 RepID=A0A1Y2CDB0_9FUNG|nr:hypothetical protein BCR33DRAFT_850308 [Rhizoclosmatium globosum]|eukprot:ORY44804.1 hypothetical protein BCR33DRAFT_850308 [Rhizoclosmatium globosum]
MTFDITNLFSFNGKGHTNDRAKNAQRSTGLATSPPNAGLAMGLGRSKSIGRSFVPRRDSNHSDKSASSNVSSFLGVFQGPAGTNNRIRLNSSTNSRVSSESDNSISTASTKEPQTPVEFIVLPVLPKGMGPRKTSGQVKE